MHASAAVIALIFKKFAQNHVNFRPQNSVISVRNVRATRKKCAQKQCRSCTCYAAPGTIANETLAYFIARVYQFLLRAGCKAEHVRSLQHLVAGLWGLWHCTP